MKSQEIYPPSDRARKGMRRSAGSGRVSYGTLGLLFAFALSVPVCARQMKNPAEAGTRARMAAMTFRVESAQPNSSVCSAPDRPTGVSGACQQQTIPQSAPAPLKSQDKAASSSQGRNKRKATNSSDESHSPGHIFWVVPAFKVDYGHTFQPLTPKQKFKEWARGTYDPLGLSAGAFEAATIEHSSSDGFCGYGKGWGGYGECFGSLELDGTDSSFIGDFLLPVVLHQDPRYFRLGEGSFGKRVWYSISRVFVTHSDSGQTVFYSSALSGTVIAAGLSNFYYPQKDRGFGLTLSRIGIDLANTALYNAAAEFWPDINHKLHRIL